MTPPDVAAWLAGQTPDVRAGIERLRAVVLSVEAPWEEAIKWNAPSFALGGEDKVTLGIERRSGWRVVLHRGARQRDDGFAFVDEGGLARWPSPDRGVVTLRSQADVEAATPALEALIRRWIEATA